MLTKCLLFSMLIIKLASNDEQFILLGDEMMAEKNEATESHSKPWRIENLKCLIPQYNNDLNHPSHICNSILYSGDKNFINTLCDEKIVETNRMLKTKVGDLNELDELLSNDKYPVKVDLTECERDHSIFHDKEGRPKENKYFQDPSSKILWSKEWRTLTYSFGVLSLTLNMYICVTVIKRFYFIHNVVIACIGGVTAVVMVVCFYVQCDGYSLEQCIFYWLTLQSLISTSIYLMIHTTEGLLNLRKHRTKRTPFIINSDLGDHETDDNKESNLHQHMKECTKNPGHKKFLAIDKLRLQDLPKTAQDDVVLHFIKFVADLTVRVGVEKVSPYRPKCFPGTNTVYPFYEDRGREYIRTGSGAVLVVFKYSPGSQHWKNYSNCWCIHCSQSSNPRTHWWEFDVYTAAHVVFDSIEAERTSLRLFFDNEKSTKVLLNKVCIFHIKVDLDICLMKCVTCDKKIATKLERCLKKFNDLREKVLEKFERSRDFCKLCFIVSHPHGFHKYITFGTWTKKETMDDYNLYTKFTYTTNTCKGSSGALVFCLGFNIAGFWLDQLLHSGTKKRGQNYSGVGHVRS